MRYLILLLAAAALAPTGCGKNNASNTFPDLGGQDSDTRRDMGDGGPNSNEECDSLEHLDDSGALLERELRATADIEVVSCGGDFDGAEVDGSWMARIEFDRPLNVVIKIDGLPKPNDELRFPPAPVWELRKGDCVEPASLLACTDDRTLSFTLEADTPYYLVVNGRLDSGGIQIQLEVSELVCEPGFSGCTDGSLTTCNDNGTSQEIAGCVGECGTSEACGADVCEDALPVTLVPNAAPIQLTGRRSAYAHDWSAEDLEGCDPYEPGAPGGPSEGVEFFLSFTGLLVGQTLVLDAEESEGNMGFYVLPECEPTACVGAAIFDFSNLNRYEFPVTEDGDVLVAIEAIGPDVERDFVIKASLSQ